MCRSLSARYPVTSILCALVALVGGIPPCLLAGDLEDPAPRGIDRLTFQPLEPIEWPFTARALAADGLGTPDDLRAAWIVDDFEDGNIDGWIDEGGGACSASISTIAALGTYSMRVDGACGHRLGRYYDVTGSRPTGVSVWVRSNTVNTFDTYFILGDADSGPGGNSGAIYFLGTASGNWSVFDGHDIPCQARNPNQWYRINFNVDWACKMYDVSIDGVLRATNVPFYYEATESFDQIHVYNWDSTTARYDSIGFSTPAISDLIFEDDFERGSTCRWSSVVN